MYKYMCVVCTLICVHTLCMVVMYACLCECAYGLFLDIIFGLMSEDVWVWPDV